MVYYLAYQDYIAKELCVQKDNQQGCNGKCYLVKKLSEKSSTKKTPIQHNLDDNFRFPINLDLPKDILTLEPIFLIKNERVKDSYLFSFSDPFLDIEIPPPKLA